MEKIIVCIDNEHFEASGEILNQILSDREIAKEREEAKAAEAESKAQVKAKVLARLGITEEEASLLAQSL